jgi:hypothetical protein
LSVLAAEGKMIERALSVDEIISYFRAIAEEHDGVEAWDSWWKRNASQVKERLNPGLFLTLKMNAAAGIYDALEEHGHRYPRKHLAALHRPDPIPKAWLLERVFAGTAEAEIPALSGERWRIVRSRMLPGDEVWRYSGDAGTGFAVVRGGVAYDSVPVALV